MYETNHSRVEKLLLAKANMQMTIRLLQRNAFYHRDGELTRQMHLLYEKAPTLFDAVLPRTDKRDMLEGEEDLEYELDVHAGGDRGHAVRQSLARYPQRPSATRVMPLTEASHCPVGTAICPTSSSVFYARRTSMNMAGRRRSTSSAISECSIAPSSRSLIGEFPPASLGAPCHATSQPYWLLGKQR